MSVTKSTSVKEMVASFLNAKGRAEYLALDAKESGRKGIHQRTSVQSCSCAEKYPSMNSVLRLVWNI